MAALPVAATEEGAQNALDERSRHDLYKRLEQVLGQDHATVLMEHLPPVGWADVATKRDLEHLEYKLLATLRAEINAQTRTMVWANSVLVLTVAGIAFGAARLV